ISTISRSKEKQEDKERVPPKPITGWRLWLFRIIALTVIPVLLLLLVELSLRVAGYGYPASAIIKCEVDGRDAYCDNVKFGWRFFTRNIARQFEPFIFPADKPNDTYRIFVLGASAAKGEPDPAFCFGRVLRLMLQEEYPAVNFEIINTAMTAINSHVVLEIAKDCARHDADLFIVYLGNNEVTGPYGAGTVYTLPLANLSVIRIGIALKATRLGQLLTNLVESVGVEKGLPRVWRGMEMFLNNQVRADAPHLEAVYQNFQKNLKNIRRIACKNGAKIIFCTVGSNLKDSPPFASLHRLDLTQTEREKWDDIYQQGAEHELAGDYAEAIECYLAAAKIDDRYADLQFRLGRCCWAKGEYDRARDRYIEACELDTLRFRADTRINKIIRDVARDKAAEGIYLTDTAMVFEKNSPHETPGEELFYEHVHLNFEGTYFLAKTVFEQVQKILPPERAKRRKANKRPILTKAECAEYLAYTDWDRHEAAYKILNGFIKKPPFTNQLYQKERVKQMEQNIEALRIYLAPEALEKAAVQYSQAIQKTPSDWRLRWKYGKLLTEGLKDYKAAADQYRLVQKFLPHSYVGHTALGAVSRGLGDLDEVIAQYLEAIRIKPTCIEAYYYVAWAYQKQDRMDKAIEYYSKTLRLQPDRVPAYNNLAGILFRQGKVEQAIETYQKGLLFVPDSSILHLNLGACLNRQGYRREALKEVHTALQLDPNSTRIRRVLESILKKGN
ncbi:MAG: tetratricopeptide repeat protein, partial [Planctomycetota bacterium]